jgi:hypothetical protein
VELTSFAIMGPNTVTGQNLYPLGY